MATCRSRARKIPTRTNNMKLLTLTLAAAMVMAAGCAQTDPTAFLKKWTPEELAEYRAWEAKQPKIRFQPGTDMLGIAPSTVVFQGAAPVPQQAPQPIIVAPSGSGVTTAGQVGGTTVVSTFGGNAAPIYTPPAYGYYGY
jgi:hypothetical protein